MNLRHTRTLILNNGSAEDKREEIREYFHKTFSIDEQLYETITHEESFYIRAEPLRHPLIFYLGHTACFYINKLIIAKIIDQRINPAYESMFAAGFLYGRSVLKPALPRKTSCCRLQAAG